MKIEGLTKGVTLIELLVVIMIIGILSTIAVTTYTGQVERARYAACRETIHQLEMAITQYKIDVGQLPPSGSGTNLAPSPPNPTAPATGCGYLQLALLHSLSGDAYHPLDYHWFGPYLELDSRQLGDINGQPISGSTPKAGVQILDPWYQPYYYIRYQDYDTFGGTERLADDPFYPNETYYNPSSFQIFSMGRNMKTYAVPYRGLETDDVNNW
ncbi:prepilin-type N-terminal cleavage/methylation domain-containing protein [Candidatus Sumerlaeota bacterium]|nr:prepilin-type N-terminal cleavage/methylation domain-containing protein [Candidatus Sumerlaeota bacterium]